MRIKLLGLVLALCLLVGCSSNKIIVADNVDFKQYDSIVFEDDGVSTSNGEGVEFVKDTIRDGFEERIKDAGFLNKNDNAARTLIIKSHTDVYWGSFALRFWIGFGAGTAHINIKLRAYDKNAPNAIMAEMDYNDMTTSPYSDSKTMVKIASQKASWVFFDEVLRLQKQEHI